MKPDWDKLAEKFAGSATQLVADVDCTTEGKWRDPQDDKIIEGEGKMNATTTELDCTT